MNRLLSRAIGVAALTIGCAGVGAAAQEITGRPDALQRFDERVAAYVELHERLAAVLPAWQPSYDVRLIERRRAHLASAITRERRAARQGDIFDPAVAAVMRGLVADALRAVDADLLLRDLYEECQAPAGYQPQVHAPYPHWATHEVPVVLLSALPVLPTGIYYRLIDHDLLLWDADANLIVDVLQEALPRGGSS